MRFHGVARERGRRDSSGPPPREQCRIGREREPRAKIMK